MKKTLLFFMALIMSAGFAFAVPSNNVPGVHIYNSANGGAYSGVNIILGADSTVWPWSNNSNEGVPGKDGVAFTPVEDATYHMTFNVTSTGVNGFRVRWLSGDSNGGDTGKPGGYTTADAAAVGASPKFTADQICDTIPGYFSSTINSGDTKTYKVDFKMDGSQPAGGLVGNLCIRGQSGVSDFVINTLQITDDDGNMLVDYAVLPASSDAPGVHVMDAANNDKYSGVNLILGSDSTLWPWSNNSNEGVPGEDGVAFTPVKDANYHMTFNVTSNGVNGFRVRWLSGDSNGGDTGMPGGYTTADAAAVGASPKFTADQVCDTIPGYFANTINSGDTKTFKVDFKMDGSQPAGGLVGNLCIRGQSGVSDFVINTLQVADSRGNLLVNYDKSAAEQSGIVQIKPMITNVFSADGGIMVNANNEKVSVYSIDGRLVKVAIAGFNTKISLTQGIYIVKVGTANPVKVIAK